MQRLLLLGAALVLGARAAGEDDLITNLPGLIFQTNYKAYSGYLNAGNGGDWQMHYFLTESKSDPANDPLVVWLQGGPGCSSFVGAFQELGPWYVNYDGKTLYENVYSWNQSPVGVGFSYSKSTPAFSNASDDQTADQNYNALNDFFVNVQPRYANRTFFLAGESYAGIYIPTLAQRLIAGINSGNFSNKNFQGAAIGNGFMNVPLLMNSLVLWGAYHAKVSPEDWKYYKDNCIRGADLESFNFTQYLQAPNNMDFISKGDDCGNRTYDLIYVPDSSDAYNYYQDCYNDSTSAAGFRRASDNALFRRRPGTPLRRKKRAIQAANTADLINQNSTDNQWGYPCWNDKALFIWANDRSVQAALHIPAAWQNGIDPNNITQPNTFHDCNHPLYDNYTAKYTNTADQFKYIIDNVPTLNFRILVYNGDVDTVCNFLGDSWHIRDVAVANNLANQGRQRWSFRNQVGGFIQRYATQNGNLTLDVLTVKGAGHMVPNDRPGPSLQIITNFLFPSSSANGLPRVDYSSNVGINVNPTPAPLINADATSPNTLSTTTAGSVTFNLFSFIVVLVGLYRL